MNSESIQPVYRDTNLQLLFGVTLIAIMGVASIAPVLPVVIEQFAISKQQVSWLITVFTFPGVFLTPFMGILADRWGRKRILVPSLFIFSLAGTACAFADSFQYLVILRFFQGVGAAAIGSLNITIIGDLYSGNRRASALGYNGSVLSIGTAGYPILGGALATWGWNYPFFLPVLAIPIGLMILFFLKNPEPRSEDKLLRYLKETAKSLKRRNVVAVFIASVLIFIILYGANLTYFPILLGHTFGASSLVTGLILSSVSITTAIASSQMGRLSRHISQKKILLLACLLFFSAMMIIPFIPSLWGFILPTMIFGAAMGIGMPSIQTLLAGLAPLEQRAAFMSMNGMVLRLGQTLGPPVMTAVFAVAGMDGVFFTGAFLALVMVGALYGLFR